MKRRFLAHLLLGLSGLLFLSVATAHAQFLIEFTDGRQMKVASYREEGEQVTVYTPSGSFAFRKGDVKQIVALGESPGVRSEQPSKAASALTHYMAKRAVRGTGEEDAAKTAVEKKPTVHKPPSELGEATVIEKLGNALQGTTLWSIFQPISGWLFQLRYLVGLLAFGKLLKMLLLFSAH